MSACILGRIEAPVAYELASFRQFVILHHPRTVTKSVNISTYIKSEEWHGSATRCTHGMAPLGPRSNGFYVLYEQHAGGSLQSVLEKCADGSFGLSPMCACMHVCMICMICMICMMCMYDLYVSCVCFICMYA
jgi:hypothetical protein